MLPSKRTVTLAAMVFTSAALSAQQVGSMPPVLEFEKVWNDGPKSFDDFAGKVVILDFAQTW
jgi:hypothetical protein